MNTISAPGTYITKSTNGAARVPLVGTRGAVIAWDPARKFEEDALQSAEVEILYTWRRATSTLR